MVSIGYHVISDDRRISSDIRWYNVWIGIGYQDLAIQTLIWKV